MRYGTKSYPILKVEDTIAIHMQYVERFTIIGKGQAIANDFLCTDTNFPLYLVGDIEIVNDSLEVSTFHFDTFWGVRYDATHDVSLLFTSVEYTPEKANALMKNEVIV